MASPTRYQTLSRENQFRFVCPIFNTEVKFAQCLQIRDAVYNAKELAVRKGCQACVKDSKCPASEVVRKISFGGGNVPDDYGSTTPVTGKVRKDVLEKIAPIIVMQRTLDNLGVGSAERALIASSSERIRKIAGIAALPSEGYSAPRTASAPAKRAPKKAAPKSDTINQAAATGDLAAAVSQ